MKRRATLRCSSKLTSRDCIFSSALHMHHEYLTIDDCVTSACHTDARQLHAVRRQAALVHARELIGSDRNIAVECALRSNWLLQCLWELAQIADKLLQDRSTDDEWDVCHQHCTHC